MANEQNLRPVRSEKEARELGRKGGIASGKARKEKATFKKAIEWLVESDIKIKKGVTYDIFKNSGIDISNLDTTQLATLGLWWGAVQGNSANYKTLMEGNNEVDIEKETPTVKIELVDNSSLEKDLIEENEKD